MLIKKFPKGGDWAKNGFEVQTIPLIDKYNKSPYILNVRVTLRFDHIPQDYLSLISHTSCDIIMMQKYDSVISVIYQ